MLHFLHERRHGVERTNFPAVGLPIASKSSVCWDPLQSLGVHDERIVSILYHNADGFRAVYPATGTDRSRSFPIPDKVTDSLERGYSLI